MAEDQLLNANAEIPSSKPGSILTFVHGTWASKSKWPELECELKKVLPQPVEVHYPQWSGANRIRSRSKAVLELQEHIMRWPKSNTANHYVVGHSHGGTVATLAMDNEEVRSRVAGLVCLSTPFFHVSLRKLGTIDRALLSLGALAQVCLLTWVSAEWAGVTGVLSMAGIGVGLLIAAIVVMGIVSVYADKLVRSMKLPEVGSIPTLILRAPADDTTLPLTSLQTIGWVFERGVFRGVAPIAAATQKAVNAVLEPGERLWAALVGIVFAYGCIVFACWLTQEWSWWVLIWPMWPVLSWQATAWGLGIAVALPISILVVAGFAAVTALELAAIMTACSSFLVGPEMIFGGLMVNAYVEAAPPGEYHFVQLGPPTDDGPFRMQHSTHSDPEAIRKVAAWLEKRVKTPESIVGGAIVKAASETARSRS